MSAPPPRVASRISFAHRATQLALSCCLTLAGVAVSSAALGGEPTPEDRTTARELALEGHRALQAGDYALAADRFQRADVLVHAPTLLLDLGRSYVGLGQLVKAHEAFQQVLREGVAADAPVPWRRALDAAQEQDAALKPRLAWVTISAKGAANPQLELDEERLSAASLGVRRAVDPGRRTIVARADGFLPAERAIDIGEGETQDVELVLRPDPDHRPPRPKKTAPAPLPVVDPPPSRTPAYVAYSVGGTGLLLSGVSTVVMLRANAQLQKDCPERQCPASSASDHSTYTTFGTLAAVGLGVGLAGVGVGTYFMLSSQPKDRAAPQPSLTARVSPGYVSLSGSF